MPSGPNLNPPASSAAVHAAVHRHSPLPGPTRRGKNHDSERGRERAKCVTARTAAEFYEALNRGVRGRSNAGTRRPGRLDGRERGRRGRDHRGAQWPARRGMAARDAGDILFGSAGKTARRRFPASSSNRSSAVWRTMQNATEPRQNTVPVGSRGRGVSESERDWAWCRAALRRGLDPAIVRTGLGKRRSGDKTNPEYYARRTVERAAASLAREIPPQYSNPLHVSDSRSPIDSHRTVVLA